MLSTLKYMAFGESILLLFLISPGHLCSECGKSFKTIHLLTSHQMLHTNEKPFGCDLCPSRFKWKAALKTHMIVHTGKKQHVCDVCGSSFTTKGSMKKHKSKCITNRNYLNENSFCFFKQIIQLN